ncbi:TPA: hypothetical protein ACH3X2_007509 [Trebouxia sp. C0005]
MPPRSDKVAYCWATYQWSKARHTSRGMHAKRQMVSRQAGRALDAQRSQAMRCIMRGSEAAILQDIVHLFYCQLGIQQLLFSHSGVEGDHDVDTQPSCDS